MFFIQVQVKAKDECLFKEHAGNVIRKTGFNIQAFLELHASLFATVVGTVPNIIYNGSKVAHILP